MQHGDISFTFLHRVEEVEQNVDDERWQSALALALTLPDICGGIAFPEVVRRYRDGRVMLDRQKKPTRDVGGQYVRWFNEFAGPYFKLSPADEQPYICGDRCWQLRCEYLHQNKGFLNDTQENAVRFHLGVNCGTSVCQLEQASVASDPLDIRIDIKQFCLRMCQAARSYYDAVHTEKDFSLYNTPVLDFIQATKKPAADSVIMILSEDPIYGAGLQQALRPASDQIFLFQTPEAAGTKPDKPSLWIVTEGLTRQPAQPWRDDPSTPVILLARNPDAIEKPSGPLTVLPMPVQLNALRRAVRAYLLKGG